MDVRLENTLAAALPELAQSAPPHGFSQPEVVLFNTALAARLGVSALEQDAAEFFSGNRLIEGSLPVATAYAGHQFGGFSPQLGDGRAVLLGELLDPNGARFDLQLKGSGPTQFSRGGDGKAALGPVLREYIISEAMFHLGVPTTRVLAALLTGETVSREGPLPGAVLCRVASSHLRIGSLEYLAVRGQNTALKRLVGYALERHYPARKGRAHPAFELLEAVALAQAQLISQWMQLGFIHGVMNTDNMTLSGETIDYGPCAFMESYDPNTVFSSIDRGGRYAYGKQSLIGKWNLARMAEAILPLVAAEAGLIPEAAIEKVHGALDEYETTHREHFNAGMRDKLGLRGTEPTDHALITDFLSYLLETNTDFTSAFRTLAYDLRSLGEPEWGPMGQELAERYLWRLGGEAPAVVAARMDAVNPLYIPRNHRVEAALTAAQLGEYSPLHELLAVLKTPFVEQPGREAYAAPAPSGFGPYRTFCGT